MKYENSFLYIIIIEFNLIVNNENLDLVDVFRFIWRFCNNIAKGVYYKITYPSITWYL